MWNGTYQTVAGNVAIEFTCGDCGAFNRVEFGQLDIYTYSGSDCGCCEYITTEKSIKCTGCGKVNLVL